MKKIMFCVILMCSLQSAPAQFNDNDYTNMLDIGISKPKNDFLFSLNYSYIYYMGLWGNVAARLEATVYWEDALTSADYALALWYGYDFRNENFHALPYTGASFNLVFDADANSAGFTSDALFGAKVFFKNFGIYSEYKYNLSKKSPQSHNNRLYSDNRLSFGVSFAFGRPHIPAPPQPEPAPQFVYHPTITPQELNTVRLAYADTGRAIEQRGRSIEIRSISDRNNFIRKYQGTPDLASVNNAKYKKLEYFYRNKVSEQEIVAMAKKEPNEFMKVRMIHDWVADIFAYDFDLLEWMKSNGQAQYTVQSLLQRERGVCYEYAVLFYTLATAAGIDTYLIADHSKPGIGHAYNMVIINGNGYIIDTTWDSGNQVKYNRYTAYKKMVSKDYFMPSVSESYRLRGW